ncbi:uncharacterized protein B0I36DRAFT_317881 [Microdochium trichocladiopsis]|uniref:Uncharacterized protein n=1 Tax=Microdochium trichocladiopsis TaxID=1682393 RepID=A0A9P8YE01_9PEZI|nr:uncharacterized protein B0I36DRAFT_317881 [Microdochium trichocladiopsis]KAH7035216.1 hypothetical protein B0I36DRAFT_317881 [Microdochium trichocladiopsis]
MRANGRCSRQRQTKVLLCSKVLEVQGVVTNIPNDRSSAKKKAGAHYRQRQGRNAIGSQQGLQSFASKTSCSRAVLTYIDSRHFQMAWWCWLVGTTTRQAGQPTHHGLQEITCISMGEQRETIISTAEPKEPGGRARRSLTHPGGSLRLRAVPVYRLVFMVNDVRKLGRCCCTRFCAS